MKVADAHCDYLYCAMEYGYSFGDTGKSTNVITLSNLLEGNVRMQFLAAWTDSKLKIPAVLQCQEMIHIYHNLLEEYDDELIDIADAKGNETSEKIRTVLTIEGGEAIEGSIATLNNYKRLGVRAMSLTWNENNELAGSSEGFGNKGLTALGKDIIDEMNDIHMAVDLAHLSDAGISDVLKRTTEPVFSSHTNCRRVCNAKRSLTDEFIKEIAKNKGIVCINFYPKQLRKDYVNASVNDVVSHIMHVVKIAGINACGIGSDFDGMPVYPHGINSPKCYKNIYDLLKSEGLNDSEIERILYKNLEDYILQFV